MCIRRSRSTDAEGTRRLRQGQSRQAVLRLVRRRYAEPSDRRIVQVADRHGYRARALSRRGAGFDGPHQRAHSDARAERDRPGDRNAQHRQAADSRGHERTRCRPRRTFRRWPRPGCRAGLADHFIGLFAPRGRRRRSSSRSLRRRARRWPTRSCSGCSSRRASSPSSIQVPRRRAELLEAEIAQWTPVIRSIGLKLD